MLTLLMEILFSMNKKNVLKLKSRKHRTFSRTKFKKSKSPKFSRDSAPDEGPSEP